MHQLPPYTIFPLGDTALVIDFGNVIDEAINKLVHSVFYQLQNDPVPAMIEAVPAYSSLTIYYDVLLIRKNINGQTTAFDWMKEIIEKKLSAGVEPIEHPGTVIRVPACYDQEYAPDLEWVASQNNISADELIQLHASRIYRVYMMGFLPGFSYMGVVNEKITAPRKLQPAPVKAGSIGIAGRQTGIYPLDSPGGWQIIGRTPLKLFDKERKDPVLLKSGDMIRFYSIPADEFVYLKNDRSNNV